MNIFLLYGTGHNVVFEAIFIIEPFGLNMDKVIQFVKQRKAPGCQLML